MKKFLILVVLMLLGFSIFGFEKGEILFDSYKMTYPKEDQKILYVTDVLSVYYAWNFEIKKLEFVAFFTEQKTGEKWYAYFRYDPEVASQDKLDKLTNQIIIDKTYNIILKVIINKQTNQMEAYPVFIYQQEQNKYLLLDNLSDIKNYKEINYKE